MYHFKWRAGLVEALTRRLHIYRREKVPWLAEVERTLDYLAENERLVPEHFEAKPGWSPD